MQMLVSHAKVASLAIILTHVAFMCDSSSRSIADSPAIDLGYNLAPLASDLLQFGPVPSHAKFQKAGLRSQLVLAGNRTNRPDILSKFRRYHDGAAEFILASLWFIAFGLILALHRCCRCRISMKSRELNLPWTAGLMMLLLFTCAAVIGCVLLSAGQGKFHGKVLHTLNFVVNQSDFTVQILRNVTDYLSLARSIHVDQIFLPANDQSEIDTLTINLTRAANAVSEKTDETSYKIRKALNSAHYALIAVAAIMLLLTLVGLVLSLLGHQHAIYIFILAGWLLVAITFILCGLFVILNSAITDTCMAMDQWVDNPQVESALRNIFPCVDQRTTNDTLYKSKQVILKLVNVVNTAIYSVANANPPPDYAPFRYNQSGPLMPPLCPPYDSQLHDRQCQEPWEVSFTNASMVWKKFTCITSSGLCVTNGRVTSEMYTELVAAVNVSYALFHYGPLVLSLQDCKFVRETFTTITTKHCPPLQHYLRLVNVGLALISVGTMLCLLVWTSCANRPQREEFGKQQSVGRMTGSHDDARVNLGDGCQIS